MKKESLAGFPCITPRNVFAALLWYTVLAPIGLLDAFAWLFYWIDTATKG